MKMFVVLFAILAAVSAVEQVQYKAPQKIVDKVMSIGKPCADENKVDYSMIMKLPDGTLPRDDATNKFLYCFCKNSGYITEDGHMVVDKLAAIVKDHPLEKEFREALVKCNEVTKENPIATLVAMNTCFAEAPPIRIVL